MGAEGMSDKLNGSFSGLWTCELCSKMGTECTCEHFDRGWAWGKDKTLTEAEMAAEVWYARVIYHESFDDAEFYGGGEYRQKFLLERRRAETLERMAESAGYGEDT